MEKYYKKLDMQMADSDADFQKSYKISPQNKQTKIQKIMDLCYPTLPPDFRRFQCSSVSSIPKEIVEIKFCFATPNTRHEMTGTET